MPLFAVVDKRTCNGSRIRNLECSLSIKQPLPIFPFVCPVGFSWLVAEPEDKRTYVINRLFVWIDCKNVKVWSVISMGTLLLVEMDYHFRKNARLPYVLRKRSGIVVPEPISDFLVKIITQTWCDMVVIQVETNVCDILSLKSVFQPKRILLI